MKKRAIVILSALLFLFALSSISIYAQETDQEDTLEIESNQAEATSEEDSSSADGIDELIKESQSFDEELGASAGLLPGSPFAFLDGISESREEKVAEMKELSELCSKGDSGACGNIDVSLEKYREYAGDFEREVSPEEKEEAERTSRAIRGAIVRDIAQNVDPTKKDELIREVVQTEKDIELAANIASQIEDLCTKLVEIGETEKAYEVCNLEEDGDAPEWLKDKRKQWKGELSENAKKFVDILQACMDSSNDDVLGNVKDKCACNEMPDKNADLCIQISTLEDACHAGEESSCGKSDAYIEEFMFALPEELRSAMEQQFGEVEEEKYGGSGESFEKEFRKRAPPQCIDAVERGDLDLSKGMFSAREQCEKIMMGEFGSPECTGLSPDECAKIMSSEFGGEPQRGHGIEFADCESFESNEKKLECYRHNAGGADFADDYYNQKRQFSEENFGEFDSEFRKEHVEDYVGFESRRNRYQSYYNNPEANNQRMEETFKREEACVRQCASQGRPWNFAEGQCKCGDAPEGFSEDRRPEFNEPPSGFTPTPENSPPPGFIPPQSSPPPESSPTTSSSPETGTSSEGESGSSSSEATSGGEGGATTTGAVITGWGRITGNAFLDYHWYG